ncbi:MAG: hypothetical protein KJO79_09215, partial [Verrucomicrobiae bacterium]|nr:hypothetical protein [Verrucomicrobiae bacterium]NNJ87348.1 hypothetical protein [Akkermansiaceae bacterium]
MNTKNISHWMSWERGVDLAAQIEGSDGSMIMVHVAAMVHTPVGSAPSGMVMVQESASAAPTIMGFVSSNPAVGAYFGPNIFAGTPFENAPVLDARIEVSSSEESCSAIVTVADTEIHVEMEQLGETQRANRAEGEHSPFAQQALEQEAS